MEWNPGKGSMEGFNDCTRTGLLFFDFRYYLYRILKSAFKRQVHVY